MFCPHCNKETPDDGYRCSHCGKVVTEDRPHAQFKFKVAKKSTFNSTNLIIALALIGAAIVIYFLLGGNKPDSEAVNSYLPGEELVIEQYIQKGRFNVVLFHSNHSKASARMSSRLKKLMKKRADFVLVIVNIDRKNFKIVDLTSPLSKQFQLNQVPSYLIYNQDGLMIKEGREAAEQIFQLLKKEKIK